MENKIKLHLLARHFDGTDWANPCTCPIATAAREYFGEDEITECIDSLEVRNDSYSHQCYSNQDYYRDKDRADFYLNVRNLPGEIIRTITLKLQQYEHPD